MVQAETGMVILAGKSGKQYAYSVYASDVATAPLTWSLNGLAVAGSSNFIIVPEDCILKDVSMITGVQAVSALMPFVNDTPTGNVIAYANTVNTLANRSIPNIGISAGRKLTIIQA